MELANSYFLLYHGEQLSSLNCVPLKKEENIKEFFEIAALLLSTTAKAYETYRHFESFSQLSQKVSLCVPQSVNELNLLQFSLIEKVEKCLSQETLTILDSVFTYLKDEQVIAKDNYQKLISLFDWSDLKKQDVVPSDLMKEKTFSEKRESLLALIKEAQSLCEDAGAVRLLNDTQTYVDAQQFSIGVTGVMKAGKSTMMNALLGKEILGTSVVPETANLSIMKYSSSPYAKVFYWDSAQWDEIQKSALRLEAMKKFVEITKANFGDEVDSYVQKNSRVDEVSIDELPLYTSAKKSGGKCNLVKYVELGVNLSFLDEGIEIVDTPGLDDPVIQREEITKEYIAKCDLMLHLMNVSQSATKKDVEFIVDALLYQNVTKLLIVITKADTVPQEQLEEVISYTKHTISERLQTLNATSKLDAILSDLMIIPVSSKMAMLHKCGHEEEALKLGYTLEKTGIVAVENFLSDTLFGPNSQKASMIISSLSKRLEKALSVQKESFEYALMHLNRSEDEIKEEVDAFSKQKSQYEHSFMLMKEDIQNYKQHAQEYITMLETFLSSELLSLNAKMKERIVGDVKYTLEKSKKLPDDERIAYIVHTAIKDGVIDIIRDYRYKFIKKSESIFNQCKLKYHEFGLNLTKQNKEFDVLTFFDREFKSGFLTSSSEVLLKRILTEVSQTKLSKIETFAIAVGEIIDEETGPLRDKLKTKASELSLQLIETFFEVLNAPLLEYEERLGAQEMTLKQMLEASQQNSEEKQKRSLILHDKLKQLHVIEKRCAL